MAKYTSGFFKDLHTYDAQHIPKNVSFHRCKMSAIQFYFELVYEDGETCLVHLQNIKRYLEMFLLKGVEANDQEDVLSKIILSILSGKSENKAALNQVLQKFPSYDRSAFQEDVEYIAGSLPPDFITKNYRKRIQEKFNLEKSLPPEEPLFHNPINFKLEKVEPPEIGDLFKYDGNKQYISKKTEIKKYPLFEKYELYRSKIPAFSKFDEFSNHIGQQLDSNKTKEELFNEFLDTFGCEVLTL
ncbi:hypothetical protein HHI36_023558 [Cryptolaemus montrouzieri]|uniref:Uncharacterized protein n=1 Tax=Cryptolaemus montrouzieri TaxID=559131 RepID=A0ABD2PHF3_9CUCU